MGKEMKVAVGHISPHREKKCPREQGHVEMCQGWQFLEHKTT